MHKIDGSCFSWMVRMSWGLEIVRRVRLSWERFRKAKALSLWPKNRIQSWDGVMNGQVGKCACSTQRPHDWERRHHNWRRTENTRRSGQLVMSFKRSRLRRPPDAQNPSAPVSWCQVLKIDRRWRGPQMLEHAIEHEGMGVSRCTNIWWNQGVEGSRSIKTPRRCAVWILRDLPISALSNILWINCAG